MRLTAYHPFKEQSLRFRRFVVAICVLTPSPCTADDVVQFAIFLFRADFRVPLLAGVRDWHRDLHSVATTHCDCLTSEKKMHLKHDPQSKSLVLR